MISIHRICSQTEFRPEGLSRATVRLHAGRGLAHTRVQPPESAIGILEAGRSLPPCVISPRLEESANTRLICSALPSVAVAVGTVPKD